jgi:ferredoxin-NADP reductase
MYRLLLNGLLVIAIVSIFLSWFGYLPFNPLNMLVSLVMLSVTSFLSNIILAKLFRAIVNFESSMITALILFLMLPPSLDSTEILVLIMAAIVANASKYLIVFRKKHIFNPAALAAIIVGYVFQIGASWWVGSLLLLPLSAVVGFLIARKIRRIRMVMIFVLVAVSTIIFFGFLNSVTLLELLFEVLTSWPLVFFGTIMLTEPLTTPANKTLRWQYAVLAGFLFGLPLRLGVFYMTPESALIISNLFSFAFGTKTKLILKLKSKNKLSSDVWEFIFENESTHKLRFKPGQFIEMTLKQYKIDARGNRRYFTIASSPTEDELKVGVKIPKDHSKFKGNLSKALPGEIVTGDQLGGDFTLPINRDAKLVFVAGGIGITPFRSMIRYLIDVGEKRDITLFYVSSNQEDFVYKDIFEQAQSKIGLKIHFVITKKENLPKNWRGQIGYITPEMIKRLVPKFLDRHYFLSGPRGMVVAYEQVLAQLKVPKDKIVTDYFPGF